MLRKAVLFVALAVIGAASYAQDSTPLQVVDANGNVLGRYATNPGDAAIISTSYGLVSFPLDFDATSSEYWNWSTSASEVYFQSVDCTGKAYISFGFGSRGVLPSLVTNGQSHHYLWVADSGTLVAVDAGKVHSFFSGDTCSPTSNQHIRNSVWVSSHPPIDLQALFTPPFKLR